jgi:excisionase family DNA binding protein
MNTQLPTREGLLSPADVARLVNVDRATVYREIQRGRLPAKHVGRQLRVSHRDLIRYLQGEVA